MKKVQEGRPSIVDRIKDGDVHFVVNTTAGKREIADSYSIRRETLMKGLPYCTTLTAARAAVAAMEAARGRASGGPLDPGVPPGVTLTRRPGAQY